jgi:hypothetical protein
MRSDENDMLAYEDTMALVKESRRNPEELRSMVHILTALRRPRSRSTLVEPMLETLKV